MNLIKQLYRYGRTAWHEVTMAVRYTLNVPYKLHIKVVQSPRRPERTYIFIHGIGNTLESWSEVYEKLPSNVRVIGVDLLGFGNSPKPYKAVYSARMQARSVMRTLLSMPGWQRPVLVGHSLGALVAVELARKYPLLFKQVVLCSPPLYEPEEVAKRRWFSRDAVLRQLYRSVRRHPQQLERLAAIAVKAGLANKSLTLTHETVGAYMASLESSIVNQSALSDIPKLKLPVTVMYGVLDPFVVGAHLRTLSKVSPQVTVRKVTAGHEVTGRYAVRLVRLLQDLS